MLAAGLRASGLDALLRRLPTWRGALVLSYHRIGERSRSDLHRGVFSATPQTLDRQLGLLVRHFDVVAPDDLDARLLATRGRHVLVTFDDGYRDLYEVAHPILQSHRVRALMFLCSGFIDGHACAWWDEIAWMLRHSSLGQLPSGPWSARPLPLTGDDVERTIDLVTRAYWTLRPREASSFIEQLASAAGSGRRSPSTLDWITWDMAREMKAAGHQIGAHSATHPILSRLSRAQQLAEVTTSMDRIAAELGERPRWFAYPVGLRSTFDTTTLEVAREAGVELAVSNYGGRLTQASFVALDIPRVSVESLRTPDLFAATLTLPQVLLRQS